jgi:hypothetical protein
MTLDQKKSKTTFSPIHQKEKKKLKKKKKLGLIKER